MGVHVCALMGVHVCAFMGVHVCALMGAHVPQVRMWRSGQLARASPHFPLYGA